MSDSQNENRTQEFFQKMIIANQKAMEAEDEIMRMKIELDSYKQKNKTLQAESDRLLNFEGDKFNFSDLSPDSTIILEINNMSEIQVKKMASALYRDYKKILSDRNSYIDSIKSGKNEINSLKSSILEKDRFLKNMNEKIELLMHENCDLKMDIFKLTHQTQKSETDGIPLEDSYVNVDYKKN